MNLGEPLYFSYPAPDRTVITDSQSGSTTTYAFSQQGDTLRPTGVSAPCPMCGNTEAASIYDEGGRLTRTVDHDGRPSFYKYDAKGRETERAVFPATYNTATTRPALTLAEKVTSTKWHATFNLPTQIAEPGKITVNTYNAKGMLTGQSWTATTDPTGAAKFAAIKTGSTYATGWGFNAGSLNTSIVQKVDGVEARRWSLVFNAAGDATKITANEAGFRTVATLTSNAAHGLLSGLGANNGAMASFTYTARNRLATANLPDYAASLTYDARSLLSEVRFGDGNWLRIVYDPAGSPPRLEDSAGASQLIAGLAEPSAPWQRTPVLATAAWAKLRALLSALQDSATATQWLPLASASAQPLPPPPMPASILQGLSLAQTQQAAAALELRPTSGRNCCSAPTAAQATAMQQHLQQITTPLTLLSLAATQAATAMGDGVLTLKSAYKLKKNLCAAGVMQPESGCHHAHHIVAVAAPAAQEARDILDAVGIDINDASNGMYVPCERHGRLHTNAYYIQVNSILRNSPRTKPEIYRALAESRALISSGAL